MIHKLIIIYIKKEILSLVLYINKFQSDLLNKKFLVKIYFQTAKYILEKDVENIASKQIFARRQSLLSIFDFEIEYIKGSENSIPDFLTKELLQNKSKLVQGERGGGRTGRINGRGGRSNGRRGTLIPFLALLAPAVDIVN